MLTPGDDFPIHQVAEPIRHVGTSDRNFYDRYYFNAHNCSGDLFLVLGLGLYPNLGTQDAFAVVRRGEKHRVVRSSRVLDDRMDLTTGPLRVEVVIGSICRVCRFRLSESDCGTTVPSSKTHSTERTRRLPAYQSSLPARFA